MLDSQPLPQAIAALNDLHLARSPGEAAQALTDLAVVFAKIDFSSEATISADSQVLLSSNMLALGIYDPDDLISIYQAIIDALELNTASDWQRYINGPTSEQSLERLVGLLKGTKTFSNRYLNQRMVQIQDAIKQQVAEGLQRPDHLVKLIANLRRNAEPLVNVADNKVEKRRQSEDTMLAKAVGGLIWSWIAPDGLLTTWYEELTRPAEPDLQINGAILQRNEISITITVQNKSQSEVIDELDLYTDEGIVYLGDLALPCKTDVQAETMMLTLGAQHSIQLRLLVLLEPEQVEQLKDATISKGVLHLPYRYFRPPKDWPRDTFEAPFDIHITSTANLNWESDLPHTWNRINRELSEQIQLAQTDTPLIVTCPRIGREHLVEVVRQMATMTANPPVIDLKTWLYDLHKIEQQGLKVNEASWLGWLAKQIWPEANSRLVRQINYEGAPRHFFETLAESERENRPELIILNNWEDLLFSLAQGNSSWEPLDRTLRFLLDWANKQQIQLIMVGTSLADRILQQRYPDVHEGCAIIHCDRPNAADNVQWDELVDTFGRMLNEVSLAGQLRRFEPAITTRELVDMCGGYLHVLDQLIIPALQALRRAPGLNPEPALNFFLDYAKQVNYFNALWMWQDFYERLALVLVAQGEIPLQDRSWAEDGLILSRDYFARTNDRKLVRQKTLAKDTRLTHREVVTIRANRFFQQGDAHVRGLSPQRPAVPEWGTAGEMFLQLLRAGGGERRLRGLVQKGLVRQRSGNFLGDYYELALPIYDAWIRDSGIWKQMLAAANSAQASWYPQRLTLDRRPKLTQSRLLFAGREHGPAYRDIPMAELQAIRWALNNKTLPQFLNFFGLSGRAVLDVQARWQALVDLSEALSVWSDKKQDEIGQDDTQTLFDSLHQLLRFEYRDAASRARLVTLPNLESELIAAADVNLQSSPKATVLRKQVLLLVIRDGTLMAEHFTELHGWARNWLEKSHQQEMSTRVGDQAFQLSELARVMKRSVVVAVTLNGTEDLRQARRLGGGGPHFVVVGIPKLTELVVQSAPSEALVRYSLDETGRSAFTPYRLRGALHGGSELFVGRDTELNAILGSIETEDHAILGSRRIGKTSLLANLYWRLTQPEFGREVLAIRINLLDSSTIEFFYDRIRQELEKNGLQKQARLISGPPRDDYNDLLELFRQLQQLYQHPTVLLIDEIDGLYLRDRSENEERFFQFLRNMLAQSQPRLCTFIMTGFRYIYLSRLEHSSVFYNFCRFQNLLGIDLAAVAILVDMLEEFKIEIEQKQEVIGLVERGTYGIPYYVQLVCDQLLESVDQSKRHIIGPNDVREALGRDIRKLLRQELWDSLTVGGTLWAAADNEVKSIKTKLALLSLILAKYDHKLVPERAHIALDHAMRTFTAADTVRHLRDWAGEVCPSVWAVTENEITDIFRSLTMTLALSPSEEDRWAYHFPNDILPDVLGHYHREDPNFDLLNELDSLMEKLKKKSG